MLGASTRGLECKETGNFCPTEWDQHGKRACAGCGNWLLYPLSSISARNRKQRSRWNRRDGGEFNTRRLWKLLWLWHSERGQTRKSSANSDEAQKAPRHQLQSFTETAPGAGLQFPKMTEMQDQ
ncbi:unnamed protein product [Durusdinium trenchii]|uniref:Uncharacterized protein n=1 Tax=Durusdinium trenchii TaxID=1381693 RepID=A0ABP0P6C1_9DINO